MKLLGCCTNCNKEVYEILERYPSDHVLAKEPRKVGKPIDAIRHEILLSDGSQMTLTYCKDCTPDMIRDWKTIMNAWERELSDEYRVAIGAQPASEKTKQWLKTMTNVLPLAVLGSKSCQ